MNNNYIYIADTNVLRVPTLRRYLFGLSAMHDIRLVIPQSLLVGSELSFHLVLSVAHQVQSRLEISNKNWEGLFKNHFADVLNQSRGWIAEGLNRNIFNRVDAPTQSNSDKILGEIGLFFKPRVLNRDGTGEPSYEGAG